MRVTTGPACLTLSILALAVAGPKAARAETPATVIVVDGSGSMWGALGPDRVSKFDLARAALRQSLASVTEARLGLVSFGHRRRGDCSDAEIVAPLEQGPPERILSLVDKLNPKGKGPLSLSLREAAKAIGADRPASIVLVHDGLDNCQQDACAAAADIARANPELAIHVVAVGMEKVDTQRMSCVARLTKGRLFEAYDKATLEKSVADAVALAAFDGGGAATPAADAAAGAAPAIDPGEPSGLRLAASLAAGGPPLTTPVAWRVSKTGEAGEPGDLVFERSAAEVTESLPEGKYVVEARYGLAEARETVEVGTKGRTPVRLAFAAGALKLAATAGKEGGPLTAPMIAITPTAAAPGARGDPLWLGRDPGAELIVPAGNYTVRVEDGLASRTADVTVAAGRRTNVPLVLGTGQLELDAVNQSGGQPLDRVIFTVSEDDPEAPSGRRELARSAAPNATFTLAAGTYYVTARSGAAEAASRIAIGTGDVVKQTVTLSITRVAVTALLDGAPLPADQPVTFRATRLDATPVEVARSAAPTARFALTPGRYRLEAFLGALNVRAAADVDVAAGKDLNLALALETGEVTIKPGPDGVSRENHWIVKDEAGRTVLRSGQGARRTARLAPGRYLVLSDKAGVRKESGFDLKAGETRAVELP